VRAAGAVLVCLVVFWTVGLFAFASRIDRSTPAADPPVSDGVVALTGASNARIAVAMQLLEDGRARRLLVSGVNPQASRDDMRGVAKAANRIYDCCVDLGYQATDTFGNARETAHWARAYSYRSLILVTSDFHMPRAMLELEVALPEVRIVAYPVRTTELDARHWWRSSDGIRRMALEYSKYLAALTQESIFRLAPRHHSASDVPAESGAAA
jgi:uncharacterized SAM-binding protein YcdF (DUF218 family)